MICIYEEDDETYYVCVPDEHVLAFLNTLEKLHEGEKYPDHVVGMATGVTWMPDYGPRGQYAREIADAEFLRRVYGHGFKRNDPDGPTRFVTLDAIENLAYREYIANEWKKLSEETP